MRVLYVSRSWGVHDRRFVDAWSASGVEVLPIAGDGSAPGQVPSPSIGPAVRAAVADFHPDLVQAGPLSDVAPRVLPHWAGPLIATSWGFDLMTDVERDPAARAAAASVLRRAEVVLIDNDAVARAAVALGATSSRLLQLPWGIDLAWFTPGRSRLREELAWDDDLVVLTTRRHEHLYRVDLVVRAFAEVASGQPRLRLLVAGAGSQTPALKEIGQRAGLGSRMHFTGELDAVGLRDAYRAADLYVSASTTDGTSVSLLEAMACLAPVCVSDIPGNRQWVTPATGQTFPVDDLVALSECLRSLGSRDSGPVNLRESRRRRAAELVRERADWDRNRLLLVEAGLRAVAGGAVPA